MNGEWSLYMSTECNATEIVYILTREICAGSLSRSIGSYATVKYRNRPPRWLINRDSKEVSVPRYPRATCELWLCAVCRKQRAIDCNMSVKIQPWVNRSSRAMGTSSWISTRQSSLGLPSDRAWQLLSSNRKPRGPPTCVMSSLTS